MHIAFFLDQHPDTLGGAQLSAKLQAKYLERLGHQVTIISPKSHGIKHVDGVVILPSKPISITGHYQISLPGKRLFAELDESLSKLPAIDVIHIQADFWGAIVGLVYAQKHDLPTIVTFHNNVEVGTTQVLGRISAKTTIRVMSKWLSKYTGREFVGDKASGWDYLNNIGDMVDVRLAPTEHFARSLREHGMRPPVEVLSNGLDDDIISKIDTTRQKHIRPQLIWTGRMSKEKRLIEFLEALCLSGADVDVAIYGSGSLMTKARRYVYGHNLNKRVTFYGVVSNVSMLEAIAHADVLVQTSVGFETQGRTVVEAIVLGRPVLLCDPLIAEDFDEKTYWLTSDNSVESLARTISEVARDIKIGKTKRPNRQRYTSKFMQTKLAEKQLQYYMMYNKK